jgi:demethylmenaquinone methyltransferase/2-methoxy-6-polyprenyl-1,4-benzoquinol methylase
VSAFLGQFHQRLQTGARVMIVDNRYVEASSTPISRVDALGNTFQQRTISNGGTYEVLKNFPSMLDVRDQLAAHRGTNAEIVELRYYWHATYRVAA